MLSMLAVVLFSAVTSCSKSDLYDPDRKEKDADKLYEENFKAYIGGEIHKDQQWGFDKTFKSTTRALTRASDATVNLSEGYNFTYPKSFMDIVKDYFLEDKDTKKPVKPVSNITSWDFVMKGTFANVLAIYSNTTANDEVGIYWYDPATETFAQAQKKTIIANIQNGLDPYYMVMVVEGRWDKPSTTDGFSVWANGVQKMENNAFTIKMDVGYYFGVYVKNLDTGKIYYTNVNLNAKKDEPLAALVGYNNDDFMKQNENNYVFGLSDDDVPGCELIFTLPKLSTYPDVVIQEEKKLEYTRIIAEDLNAHDLDKDGEVDDTDFDFNDIVLDVAIDTEGKAHCILQAAGATLKIRVNKDDNLEVHKLFDVGEKEMVNTNKGPKKDPVEFVLDGPFSSVRDVPIHVYRQNTWMELRAPKAQAASKIAVPADFVWPDERVSIKEKYPDFPRYAKDNIDEWWKNVVK